MGVAEAPGSQTLILQALSPGPFPHTTYKVPILPAKSIDTRLRWRAQGWRNSHIQGSQSRQWGTHQTGRSWMPRAQGLDTRGESQPWVDGREGQRGA